MECQYYDNKDGMLEKCKEKATGKVNGWDCCGKHKSELEEAYKYEKENEEIIGVDE